MCTLSFYPKPDNKGFILTFSRDEMPNRSTVEIVKDVNRGLIYPKDALHGGTWFAVNQTTGRFTCLLNGAFEIHKRQLPYRKSRGLVLLESFDYEDIHLFCQNYDFKGIEPCTILLLEKKTWIELRWDGEQKHINVLDETIPHIWSSCTLYNKEIRQLREKWFSNFLKKLKSEADKLLPQHLWQFHQTSNDVMPENAILMHRPSGPCTVSISQLNYDFLMEILDFKYYELEKRRTHEYRFSTKENYHNTCC